METHWFSRSDFLENCLKFAQNLAWAPSLSTHLQLLHHTSITPRYDKAPYFPPCLTFSHFPSPLHFLSSSSPIVPLKLSVSPSHASLCVLFLAERCLVQPSVSYFSLFLSPCLSFSLYLSLSLPCRPCQSHPSEELFSASPFKILETLWSLMAVCRRARTQGCVCVFVCVLVCLGCWWGGWCRERTSLSKKKEKASCCESFVNSPHWHAFCLWMERMGV